MSLPPFDPAFYVHVHDVRKQYCQNNPELSEGISDIVDENYKRIGLLRAALYERQDKDVSNYESGSIDHRKDIRKIENWLKEAKNSYYDKYAVGKVNHIFDRIRFWFYRLAMYFAASSLQGVIDRLKKHQVPFPMQLRASSFNFSRSSLIDSLTVPEITDPDNQISICSSDCQIVFGLSYTPFPVHVIAAGRLFHCVVINNVSPGSIGYTIENQQYFTPSNEKISFQPVHLKNYKQKKVTLLLHSVSSKDKDSLKATTRVFFANKIVYHGQMYSQSGHSYQVLLEKKRTFGYVTNDTQIKLYVLKTLAPKLQLQDQVIQSGQDTIFTFEICKKKKKDDPNRLIEFAEMLDKSEKTKTYEFSEEELMEILRLECGDKPFFLNQEIKISLDNDMSLKFKLIEVEYNGTKRTSVSLYYNDITTLKKYVLEKSAKIRFENNNNKVTLIPAPKIHQMSLMNFLEEEGIIGLPDSLQTSLNPILLNLGPASALIEEYEIHAPRGIILHGPPGTGKSSFASKLAKYLRITGWRLQMISATEILSKWMGESEEAVRDLFAPAEKAFQRWGKKSPLFVVIIDEIDAILGARQREGVNVDVQRKIVDQFLSCMDGLSKKTNILVIGTTNDLQYLDDGFKRPGRFIPIAISLPNKESREKMFQFYLKLLDSKGVLKEINYQTLAEASDGLCGDDIRGVVDIVKQTLLERYSQSQKSVKKWKKTEENQITQKDLIIAIQKHIEAKKAASNSQLGGVL